MIISVLELEWYYSTTYFTSFWICKVFKLLVWVTDQPWKVETIFFSKDNKTYVWVHLAKSFQIILL